LRAGSGKFKKRFSRLRDQAPRKYDFSWWRCRQKEPEADLAQPKGASAQSTVVGPAELSKVVRG